MCFALEITHIGEAVVAYLLNNNERVKEKLKELANLNGLQQEAESNVPIDNPSDPMHRIDVLVTYNKNSKIAIEVKFGTAITTPGEYCKRYLSKGDANNKGNMLNKLASGIVEIKNNKIERKWILLVLNETIKNKLEPKKIRLGEKNLKLWKKVIGNKNCVIISLEELLTGVSERDFNRAVRKCISSDNYYQAWGIEPAPSEK